MRSIITKQGQVLLWNRKFSGVWSPSIYLLSFSSSTWWVFASTNAPLHIRIICKTKWYYTILFNCIHIIQTSYQWLALARDTCINRGIGIVQHMITQFVVFFVFKFDRCGKWMNLPRGLVMCTWETGILLVAQGHEYFMLYTVCVVGAPCPVFHHNEKWHYRMLLINTYDVCIKCER